MSISQCKKVKNAWSKKNKKRIASDDNLLGIGVGLKETDGLFTKTLAVKYFVRTKKKSGLRPGEKLPEKLDSTPTDVVQMAPLRARGRFVSRLRPALGGCSGCVVVDDQIYTGTLGLAMRGYGSLSDRTFILSNNHVLADENNARIGDPVVQPGLLDDADLEYDIIGELYDFVPLNFELSADVEDPSINKVDAACALVNEFGAFNREIFWIGYPKGWRNRKNIEDAVANSNVQVQKTGRTTGYTTGTISAVTFDGWVGYDSGFAYFEDQILITPGGFSDAGDSGSCILDMDGHIIGLLFAGGATHTIANFIEDVWQALPPVDFTNGVI